MSFQIAESDSGLLPILTDGLALPYYADPVHYSIDDYLQGHPIGCYALPIPLPAQYVFQYQLPKGILIFVGTVFPMFGQSGGGVEVCLPADVKGVNQIGSSTLQDY